MKKSLLAIVCAATSLSMLTGAVEIRELSLNGPSYTPNVTVKPMDNQLEMSKHTLSYDFEKINFNHEYAGAKHVIDRLPMSQQTQIIAYWHEALLDRYFAPAIKEGGKTLSEIVKSSRHNTSSVKNLEDSAVYLREAYSLKFNDFYDAQVLAKDGQNFDVLFTNRSKHNIKEIEGHLRIVDTKNGRILIDQDVKQSIRLAADSARKINLHVPSRVEGWAGRSEDMAYKYVTTAVVLTNGQRLAIDDLYQKHTANMQKQAKQQ